MTEHSNLQWKNDEIASRLKSAMDTLTPDVLDKIDLHTPQDFYREVSKPVLLYKKMRTAAAVAVACLCIVVLSGGVSAFQNSRIESSIAIDVNPSIELSVNRNDKVLKVEALNEDAVEILDDMDLKNVDLDIAVNAVIGSMVRHGYLDELDNAILVTVASGNKDKAALLRRDVVEDIESSLEEHKLEAVVYDQQADVTDEVKSIASEYGISYGKAYFLQELVAENNLTDEDLETFAGMTMEEISREIADRSYNVKKDDADETEEGLSDLEKTSEKENTAATASATEDTKELSTEVLTEGSTGTTSSAAQTPPQTPPQTTAPPVSATAPSEAQEEETTGSSRKPSIDYADYDSGKLNVVFKDKVKWKNTTVSVKDENGESYSAKFTDTGSDSCEIEVTGLPGGVSCVFTLGGVAAKDGGSYSTVKGYFDTPDIADDVTEATDETDETQDSSKEEVSHPETTAAPVTTEAATAVPPETVSGAPAVL